MAFTSGNDVNILQATDSAILGAGTGNDKYIASPAAFGASKSTTISDTGGNNTLQLISGLTIVSSLVASDTLQLTLSNGCKLTILSASLFSFEIGGDPLSGTAGIIQTFSEFVTTSLGTTVPAAGAAASAGTPNLSVTNTGVVPPVVVPTYTLTASSATVNEGVALTYTLTAATAPAEDTIVTVSVVPGVGLVTDQGTDTSQGTSNTNPNDFPVAALNPKTVTIKAGETTATFSVTTLNDGLTELPENYSVTAMIGTATVATKVMSVLDGPGNVGMTFKVNGENAAAGTVAGGNEVMRLTGDQYVRIDFTNPANQVKGLDLNGDSNIQNNGVENNITGVASNFEIVDAYARNSLDETNKTVNFLGNIAYDGTGFAGDGVTTDGNIFLGGLGADTALGGIGNDFLVGGGVALARAGADSLSGGRNADFFFVEMSQLDNTDQRVGIDGGVTADDSVAGNVQTAQDADWLLLEASDDDEPVTVTLRDDTTLDVGEGAVINTTGSIVSRSGVTVGTLLDIENFDASGNLYGFLNNVDVQLGGRGTDSRDPAYVAGATNNGQGSSAQLVVSGSGVANIIVGGYDNDNIAGNAGNDLLMGGNLANLINPNLLTIVNDGMDILTGGSGNDHIVFEADGGNIEGDVVANRIDRPNVQTERQGNDTLWLTSLALGTKTAAEITDGVLRFDLNSQNIDRANGYGGADVGSKDLTANDTQDQTNYTAAGYRVTVQDMENVIATGLGAVDYDTDGSNTGDIAHLSQVNQAAYTGDLTLRGTDVVAPIFDLGGILLNTPEAGINVLYASSGNDKLEGRTGGTYTTNGDGTLNTTVVNGVQMPTGDARDKLSGGNGDDDFIFNLQFTGGDGVDVIHRQADVLGGVNGDNIWDGYNAATDTGTFVQDFGQVSAAITANSKLTLTLTDASHPADLTGFPVDGVAFTLDGVAYSVKLTSGIQSTYEAFNTGLNAALDAIPALAHLNSVLNADKTMTITDPNGKTFVTSGYTFVGDVVPPAGTLTWNQAVGGPSVSQTQDRLIYRAYEDRLDNELVNDNAITGSTISLGADAYAEDLVINFAADGTRIAEDQSYNINFANLTTQDKVTVAVNGVTYTLTVGVDLDGNSIANEDGVNDNQVLIQHNFLIRLNAFINSFMDNDTAAGQVNSALIFAAVDLNNDGDTADAGENAVAIGLTLNQLAYNTEETVFMTTPIVTVVNASANGGSGGEVPVVTVTNNAGHEVLLFNYDGRNLLGTGVNLDGTNVKFWGDTETNQSLLQTANNLTGGTITGNNAVVVDGGANDLAGIVNNTATNANLAVNFSVHGDDFILGASKVDTINAGTGDDRVQGSAGNDVLDGGKNYYAVKVLGEAESRVLTWNAWEAANPLSAQSLLADPTLAGKTLTSVTLIGQTEDGVAVIGGAFDDTLIYAQNDFTSGATRFTVALNNYTVNAGVVALNNGGAGTVGVDLTGDGVIDSTSTFTNFENVRTVSGTGFAVAGVGGGQGKDTLDVSALSTSTGGVSYDLTNRGVAAPTSTAGDVRYSINVDSADGGGDIATALFADENDFETAVIKVDGVESVIGGTGNDLLMIDETEAAKDNSFTAALGADRIEYLNDFATAAEIAARTAAVAQTTIINGTDAIATSAAYIAGGGQTLANASAYLTAANLLAPVGVLTAADILAHQAAATAAVAAETALFVARATAQPSVTIKLDSIAAVTTVTAGTDTVTMTGGRVGSTVAVDSLTAVERIALNGFTAQSSLENDLVDVTAITAGAVVDYTNGQVRDAAGVHVTVENLYQMEMVSATGGNDTVIVANSPTMALNSRSDELNLPVSAAKDITFASWYDFEQANTLNTARVPFASQTTAQIIDVFNENQFQFNLGAVGSDTVDYSAELNTITAVVNFNATDFTQRVIVDNDNDGVLNDASRVDLLTNVENIVAAKGTSIIDVTNSTKNIKIEYSAGFTVAANLNAATDTETRTVVLSEYVTSGVGGALGNINLIEKIDNNNNATVPAFVNAAWDRIEGGDMGERVYLTAAESRDVHTMNLRGGENLVSYQGMGQNTIVAATVGIAPATTAGGLFSGVVTVNALTTDADPLTASTTDVITSFTQDNKSKAGTLELWGGGYGTDTISFAGGTNDKFYQMGVLRNGSSWTDLWSTSDRTVPASISLTAFEGFVDDATNDVYDLANIAVVRAGFLNGFADAAGNDHDTVKVAADAINYNGAGANTVDLDNLSAVAPGGFNFDFDVLDMTNLITSGLILNGGTNTGGPTPDGADVTDEVVVGALSLISNINDFESVVLTQASVAAGGTFVLDTTNNRLTQGSTVVAMNNNNNVLSAGGLALETELGNSYLTNVTTAVSFTATGTEGVTFIGGDGADTLIGSSGNDTLVGGKGNDTMDGSFVAAKGEIYRVNIPGVATTSGVAGSTMTIGGLAITTAAVPALATEIAAGADADAIGAKFASQTLTNWKTALATAGLTVVQANELQSVTYDAVNNNLDFTFSTAQAASLVAAALITNPAVGGVAGAVMAATEADFQLFTPRVESADTFTFGKSAAFNGVDTILNLDGTDTLNFAAYQAGVTSATIAKVTTINDASAFDAGDKLVVINNNGGADLTATTLAAQFLAATPNRSFSMADIAAGPTVTTDTSVVWEAGNVGTAGSLWYVDATDSNMDGVLTDGEVVATKVATLTAFNGVFFSATAAADTLLGTSGNDVFNATGGTFGGAETISGGAGTDTLNMSEVSVSAWAAGVTGVEVFNMLSANGAADGLTTTDGLVGAGATLTFNLTGAGVGDTFTINGAAELDGSFVMNGSAQADTLIGGALADTFTGGSGADTITGNGGNDIINIGADADNAADVVVINSALATSADTINGFAVAEDDLNFSVAGLGLNAGDYAAGAVTVVNAAAAAVLGAGLWNNHIVVDTAAAIAALTIGVGSAAGGVLAIASDTGTVLFDANGVFSAGAVLIGTVTGGGAFTAADLAMIA